MKKKKILYFCILWYRKVYSRYHCENCFRLLPQAIFLILLTSLAPSIYAQQEALSAPGYQALPEAQVQPGGISLDIKGMDIIDVLKILAMRGNLNIVAGKNVRGKVTVFLKNVDVMDALEIILVANELTYEKTGDIIKVMTERDYELLYGEKSYDKKDVKIIRLNFAKATEVGKSLNQIKSKIGKVVVDESSNTIVLIDVPESLQAMEQAVTNMDLPTITKTFILNYATVKDLEDKIKESLSKNIGEIKIDERTNRIVVTDLPEKINYITRIISDFDDKNKIVLIEAKIVQITLNKDLGYGINWNIVFAGIDTIAQSDLSINLPGVTGPTTFTYTRAEGEIEPGDRTILRLLAQLGQTNVLSSPRITVANNQEAKVLVGTKEAFVTSTVTQSDGVTTTADNVEFVDVGVRLSVTPTINDDGYITMKIKPEVSAAPTALELTNPDGSIRTSVPIVTTSEAETTLAVKDGTTIIMAGLMEDSRIDNVDKIPVLGDIPLLGHFFSSRGKETEKTELVIFLTPRIIKEGVDDSGRFHDYMSRHERLSLELEGESVDRSLSRSKVDKNAPIVSSEIITPLTADQTEDFRQYCRHLSDKINHSLRESMPAGIQEEEVQLSFVLSADGYLQDEPIILSDVNEEVEDLLIKGVERVAPFSAFPEEYTESEEVFRVTIYFAENL